MHPISHGHEYIGTGCASARFFRCLDTFFSYIMFGLLQCTLYGAACGDYLKSSAGEKCCSPTVTRAGYRQHITSLFCASLTAGLFLILVQRVGYDLYSSVPFEARLLNGLHFPFSGLKIFQGSPPLSPVTLIDTIDGDPRGVFWSGYSQVMACLSLWSWADTPSPALSGQNEDFSFQTGFKYLISAYVTCPVVAF